MARELGDMPKFPAPKSKGRVLGDLPEPTALAPASAPEVGTGAAAWRGVEKGATLGARDKIAGLAGAYGDHLQQVGDANAKTVSPTALAAVRALNGDRDLIPGLIDTAKAAAAEHDAGKSWVDVLSGTPVGGRPFGDTYAAARGEAEAGTKAAQAQHPWAFGTGEVGGGLLAAAAVPGLGAAKGGASPALRALAAAKTGAKFGAANAAGSTHFDDPAHALLDIAVGTVGGGVGGGVLQAGGEVVVRGLRPLATKLSAAAVEYGRKALTGFAPINAKKPLADEAVNEAYRTAAIRPLATVEGIKNRLEGLAETRGDAYGAILESLAAKGITGPNATRLAKQIAAQSEGELDDSLISSVPGFYKKAAEEMAQKRGLNGPGSDLGLMQAEKIKRQLQHAAKQEYSKVEGTQTEMGEAKMSLASTMRKAIEEAVEAQASKAPDDAAAFLPVKQNLALTLQAYERALEGASRAAGRKAKRLVEVPKTITDLPIVDKMAANVVNDFADTRTASTLGSLAYYGARGARALAGANLQTRLPTPAGVAAPVILEALRGEGETQPVSPLDPRKRAIVQALRGGPREVPASVPGPVLVPSMAGAEGQREQRASAEPQPNPRTRALLAALRRSTAADYTRRARAHGEED